MPGGVGPYPHEMAELPPDLARVGDALEHAVSRAIRRRRGQLRAAGALAAVLAAVPMAVGATNLYLRGGEGRVPAGVTRTAPQSPTVAPDRRPVRSQAATSDRVPPAVAAGRTPARQSGAPPHPLDTMPPPISARAGSDYDPGVATERVDRRPAFPVKLL